MNIIFSIEGCSSCIDTRQTSVQADFSSRRWWPPSAATQSPRRRRAALLGSLPAGCKHHHRHHHHHHHKHNITRLSFAICMCFIKGASGVHPPHSHLQHWTDLPPLVPPCLRYNQALIFSSLQLCLCSREWRRHAELRLHLHPHTHPGQPLGLLHLLPCHEARLRGEANLLGKIRSETFSRWFDVCVTQTGVGPFCPVVSVQLCSCLLLFQGGEEL